MAHLKELFRASQNAYFMPAHAEASYQALAVNPDDFLTDGPADSTESPPAPVVETLRMRPMPRPRPRRPATPLDEPAPQSNDESKVLIEVQDSGTGIAVENLESIFDPFVTSKLEGLGMGLSICRSIIERHGGTISAANNPVAGATFSITLPVTRE